MVRSTRRASLLPWAMLLLCGLVITPRLTTAATYYVATNGDDSRSCATAQNINTPKRTLVGQAITCLQGTGDTLFLRGGTYDAHIIHDTYPGGSSWDNPTPGGSVVWIGAYYNGSNYESVTIQGNGHDGTIEMSFANYVIWDHLHVHGTYSGSTALQAGQGRQRFQHGEVTLAEDPPCAGGTVTNGILIIIYAEPTNPVPGGAEFLDNNLHESHCNYAFYIQHYTEYLLIDGNRIYDNYGYGFHAYINHDACQGYSTVPCFHNIIFRNNLVYNNGNPFHQCAIATRQCDNCQFYNNVFYDNWCGIELSNDSQNTKYFNNTFYNHPADFALPLFQIDSNNGSGIEVKNNVSYRGSCGFMGGNGGCGVPAGDHMESNNVYSQGEPPAGQFVNVGARDFHLQAGSSGLINAGTNTGLATDRDGAPRPQGGSYDIGAYEFGGGGTALPVPTNLRVLSLTP